jgi:protein-S-isoprenylcysteine O-methyltransferase Ste14
MWPEFEVRVVALVFFAGLVLAGAASLPVLRGMRPTATAPEQGAPVSRASEALWLAAVAVVYLYPLGVAVDVPTAYGPLDLLAGPLVSILQAFGFALAFVGLVLVPWSVRALGRYTTFRIEVREDQPIVDQGPYARIRHPLYSANLFVGLGLLLAFLSAWLVVPAIVIVVLAVRRASAEEEMFLRSPRLGARYAEYVARTGRFLPRRAARGEATRP